MLARLAECLQLDEPQVLRYVDSRRQCSRTLKLVRNVNEGIKESRLAGFLLCGDASAGQWLGDVLKGEL